MVLAHRICLLNEEGELKVCVVEFGYLDFKETPLLSLKEVLRESPSLRHKLKVFKCLIKTVGRVHGLGVSHLSLNPE